MTRTTIRTCSIRECVDPLRIILAMAFCFWFLMIAFAFAQPAVQPPAVKPPTEPPAAEPPAKPPVAKPAAETAKPKVSEEAKKPPEPEPMFLETKDGWKIHCLYYAPMEKIRKGKQTVPIILLHGWGGQGSEWSYLATGLQTYGHAAIVPDLRGHGRSTTRKEFDGSLETIKYDDLKPQDLERMILDVEAVKGALLEKNNAGELNIDMLTLIAAEEGCIVAVQWAVWDWHWPITTAGKQGQDVKGLILLSPLRTHKRMSMNDALNPRATNVITKQLSILIAVGAQDRRAESEADKIHNVIEGMRPPLPQDDPQEILRLKDLFLIKAPTELQGTKLTERTLPINRAIVTFIQMRLLNHRDEFLWKER